jgi:hypothetical protein
MTISQCVFAKKLSDDVDDYKAIIDNYKNKKFVGTESLNTCRDNYIRLDIPIKYIVLLCEEKIQSNIEKLHEMGVEYDDYQNTAT